MNVFEMTDFELGAAHAEALKKAQAARADGDLDLAQRYLRILRGFNVEMHGRIQTRRIAA